MKKSKLTEENLRLFKELDSAKREIKALNGELGDIKKALEAETEKNAALEKKLEELSASKPAEAPKAEPQKIAVEPAAVPAREPASSKLPEAQESAAISLDDELAYAADVIGELVIESAKYSDKLAAAGNPGYIELVNLVLGKTEVSKAEILSIARQELSVEVKRQRIDAVKTATLEYYESVMAQRS